MRFIVSVAAVLLALTASANAASIECDEMGGHLVDMPEHAEAALVSVGEVIVMVAEPDARIQGAISADEFCREFGGDVAFVLPIPKPGIDDTIVPAVPDVPGQAGGVGRPTQGRQEHAFTLAVPEPPDPGTGVGRPQPSDDEPAPLPADIVRLEDPPGPDVQLGCTATGRAQDAPWGLALLLLGLRRRAPSTRRERGDA